MEPSLNPVETPIAEFPAYSVSQEGHVIRGNRALRWHYDDDGYPYVILFKNGKRAKRMVHLLVLVTYHGARPKGYVARHLDGDAGNPHVSNLAWCTQRENIQDKWRHGTMPIGERVHNSVLSRGDVEWIRAYPQGRGMFQRMADRLQVSRTAVRHAYYGKTWAHV